MRVTQLLLSNSDKVLFAGTTEGGVHSFIWGADGGAEGGEGGTVGATKEGQQYLIAHGGVTRLGVSSDETQLFVASEDGSLFMLDIHLIEDGEVACPPPSREKPFDPKSSTLDLRPQTLNPRPQTLNPQPQTINPQPSTPNPQPSTLDPKP
jgi:hypothetical protein